jgi:hypothetical protein
MYKEFCINDFKHGMCHVEETFVGMNEEEYILEIKLMAVKGTNSVVRCLSRWNSFVGKQKKLCGWYAGKWCV